jgi:hypothetical protein
MISRRSSCNLHTSPSQQSVFAQELSPGLFAKTGRRIHGIQPRAQTALFFALWSVYVHLRSAQHRNSLRNPHCRMRCSSVLKRRIMLAFNVSLVNRRVRGFGVCFQSRHHDVARSHRSTRGWTWDDTRPVNLHKLWRRCSFGCRCSHCKHALCCYPSVDRPLRR